MNFRKGAKVKKYRDSLIQKTHEFSVMTQEGISLAFGGFVFVVFELLSLLLLAFQAYVPSHVPFFGIDS